MRRFRILLIAFLGLLSFAVAQKDLPDQETPAVINAVPIPAFQVNNPSQLRFGSLEFRGGLVLTSTHRSFGGISALHIHPDGERFIALSDRTAWIRGRILYEGKRPASITEASIHPVLNPEGQPASRWDTESIAADGTRLYVGLEGMNSIFRFDYDWKSFPENAQPIPVPPELKTLPSNQGLEALVFVPKRFRLAQTLIGFSEHGLTKDGNLKAFLIGGPTPGTFAVKRTDGFDISDAALLPDGDILILERQFSLQRGVAMRIRRIRMSDIKPDALVDGPAIIDADIRSQLDNMEALNVHRTPEGETLLTLISDDNFSPIQRTILLQFVLMNP